MPIYKKNRGLDFPYFMDADIREVAPKLINNWNQLQKIILSFEDIQKNFIKKT